MKVIFQLFCSKIVNNYKKLENKLKFLFRIKTAENRLKNFY